MKRKINQQSDHSSSNSYLTPSLCIFLLWSEFVIFTSILISFDIFNILLVEMKELSKINQCLFRKFIKYIATRVKLIKRKISSQKRYPYQKYLKCPLALSPALTATLLSATSTNPSNPPSPVCLPLNPALSHNNPKILDTYTNRRPEL